MVVGCSELLMIDLREEFEGMRPAAAPHARGSL